jgi:hypothetical protein
LEGAGGDENAFVIGNLTRNEGYGKKRSFLYWISSAAAVALLCIGLFFATLKPPPSKMADTFSDPEEAALVAGQTLAFISAQLNNGLDRVSDVENELKKVNQVLNKHLK